METIGPFRPPFGPALGWPAQEGPPCAGTNRAEMGAAPRKEAGLRQMREREGRHTRCGIPPVDDHASAQIRSLSGDGFLCRRPVIPVAIRNRAIRRPARAPLPVPRPPLHPFPMQPPRPQPADPPGGRPLSSKLHSGCRAASASRRHTAPRRERTAGFRPSGRV